MVVSEIKVPVFKEECHTCPGTGKKCRDCVSEFVKLGLSSLPSLGITASKDSISLVGDSVRS